MLSFFQNRNIPVEFRDVPPTHLVDTTPFESSVYNAIKSNGFSVSPFKLIHCAAVHYQSRFRKLASLRWLNSFIELKTSLSNNNTNGLYLTDIESNEFQTRSSEVVAVGLCVFLFTKLLNINTNKISTIEGAGKRCDFSVIKNGMEIIFESKGRKQLNAINAAVNDIFYKKTNYSSQSKYGVISYLPRNNSSAKVIVVDPEFYDNEISRKDTILRLLIYYTKLSYLAGFWRLADLLNIRIKKLLEGSNINEFEDVSLDYRNIFKIGIGYEIRYQDIAMETYFNSMRGHGFYHKTDEKIYFLSLDKRLIEILERQRFEELLEYRCTSGSDVIIDVNRNNLFSVNTDGSVLCSMSEDEIPTTQ